ncbi:MAG: hypothetical protein ACK56I_26265 [bacterium]
MHKLLPASPAQGVADRRVHLHRIGPRLGVGLDVTPFLRAVERAPDARRLGGLRIPMPLHPTQALLPAEP